MGFEVNGDPRLADLAARLDAVVEELDDLAFEGLRVAAAEGDTTRPTSDKELVRARRAVERAAHLVRGLADAPER